MEIVFKKLIGNELQPYLEEFARLRIAVFREFPYLYDGNLDYERKYLSIYTQSKRSMVVLALVDNKIIGATTCLPLEDESEEFQKAFANTSFDVSKIFYFGESIILKDFRGHKIGHHFFEFRENHSRLVMPELQFTMFCAVKRENDHPLRPESYRPLDLFWQRMGYCKQEGIEVVLPWKDIDKDKEDDKSLNIWLKKSLD